MLTRLLKADLARSAVVALTLIALIALASTLMSASTSLIVDTASAMSRLSQRAKVPDLIQMHTGDLDPATIEDWTDTRSDITEHEIIKTMPIPRQELWIDGVSQTGSYHEPAFVTAPRASTCCWTRTETRYTRARARSPCRSITRRWARPTSATPSPWTPATGRWIWKSWASCGMRR